MPDMTKPLQKKWTEVDDYIASLLIPPDAALDGALKASDEAGCRPSMYQPIRASCSCCLPAC